MPAGLVAKMMSNKQQRVVDDYNNITEYLNYSAKMTNIDYSRCDSLVPKEQPAKEIHYKVNLSHAEEIEYKINLSKREI